MLTPSCLAGATCPSALPFSFCGCWQRLSLWPRHSKEIMKWHRHVCVYENYRLLLSVLSNPGKIPSSTTNITFCQEQICICNKFRENKMTWWDFFFVKGRTLNPLFGIWKYVLCLLIISKNLASSEQSQKELRLFISPYHRISALERATIQSSVLRRKPELCHLDLGFSGRLARHRLLPSAPRLPLVYCQCRQFHLFLWGLWPLSGFGINQNFHQSCVPDQIT